MLVGIALESRRVMTKSFFESFNSNTKSSWLSEVRVELNRLMIACYRYTQVKQPTYSIFLATTSKDQKNKYF